MYSKRINPSTDDFLKAIEIVDAKNVFILPNDSNLFLAAEQARKLEKKSKVFVLPAKNIAQGMRAALNFNPELSAKENNKNMWSEIKYAAFGYVTVADRDVEIDGIKIGKKHFFSAVSFLNKDGKEKIIASNENLFNVIKVLFTKLIWDGAEIITIFKGKGYSKDQINFMKKILDEDYDIEYEIVDGDQEVYNFLFVVE